MLVLPRKCSSTQEMFFYPGNLLNLFLPWQFGSTQAIFLFRLLFYPQNSNYAILLRNFLYPGN